ncbi:MAG: metallophosphoesterase [Nocardioides sp.]|nr:metallophosphoesterase [Nocardioides sp.]
MPALSHATTTGEPATSDQPAGTTRRRASWELLRRGAVPLVGWAATSVVAALLLFFTSSTTAVVAGHETSVRPTLDQHATIELGPYLPALRYPVDARVGAHLVLGRTTAQSYDELIERYALIASQPEGQIARVSDAIERLAVDAVLDGVLIGLAFPALWFLVGPRRRRELVSTDWRRTTAVVVGTGLVVLVAVRPWVADGASVGDSRWQPVAEVLPEGVPVPDEVALLELDTDLLTAGARSLVTSALDTYQSSFEFYGRIVEAVPAVADQIRTPAEDETVALFVADRHDNIGMDPVARAIGDAGGATMLLNGGDDTSVGASWEAFSLDSLAEAFADYPHRYVATGNHDNGTFVPDHLNSLGFEVLRGDRVEGPDGIRLLGVPDPRSSGLGNWRSEPGISFGDQRERLTEDLCAADAEGERITTLLVHDANLGNAALDEGCVDLVVGGHLHVQSGPEPVLGENGRTGWSYTNGTTGGAAYALAIGSKLRREAQVSLITYREGRPVGIQPVSIRTTGEILVADYVPLTNIGRDSAEGDTDGVDEAEAADEGEADEEPTTP